MYEIVAEGMPLLYFTKSDELPASVVNGKVVRGLRDELRTFIHDAIQANSDFRLVLIAGDLKPDNLDVYYLHWDDNSDLDSLDDRVIKGLHTDEDFANSITTIYQRTLCTNCDWIGDTLVVPPVGSTTIMSRLHDVKAPKRKNMRCPTCNTYLRQFVVKIL
jgi:hypothetical protein